MDITNLPGWYWIGFWTFAILLGVQLGNTNFEFACDRKMLVWMAMMVTWPIWLTVIGIGYLTKFIKWFFS